MGSLTIEPVNATLGAVVTGVRLAGLHDDTWAEVEAAFHEHAVLVFPGQHLTGAEQMAFGCRFGALENIGYKPGYTPITNQLKDGALRDPGDAVMAILKGNEHWHTDSSYMPLAAKASMLSAHVVPRMGGTTEWADMRAAYDALSEEMKATIATLSASHSIAYGQRKAGLEPSVGFYGFDVAVPPRRPLVKIHPVTGRPSLYLGRHAYAAVGLSDAESEASLDGLVGTACRAARVYARV